MRSGDADDTVEPRVQTGDGSFDEQRFGLDPFDVQPDAFAREGEVEPVRGPLQQTHAHAGLQRSDSASDGRLSDVQVLGGGGQSPVARHGKKEPEIIPVEQNNLRAEPHERKSGTLVLSGMLMPMFTSAELSLPKFTKKGSAR